MTEKRSKNGDTSSVMGALPSSRPHRRSEKRKAPAAKAAGAAAPPRSKPAAAAGTKPAGARPLRQPPQPRGLPRRPETSRPKPAEPAQRPAPPRRELLATAVQAAAELTEMGLSAGARALREAVSRLPRP